MVRPNNTEPNAKKLRLVIVDDEPAIRSGLVDLFPWNSLGYDVIGEFDDGQQALDFLLTNHVDVVLTDIRMPIMDGIALAEAIHEERPEIIVVFLSSYTEFEYARQGILLGVKDYIVKPVKYQVLTDTFSKLYDNAVNVNSGAAVRGDEETPAQYQGYYPEIVSLVKQYVEEHLAGASLETAAAAVGFSPNYISRVFHKHAQTSFSEYLLAERMKKAAALLLKVNIKLYEISELVGYDNAKSFSRAFSQYYGTTPSEYRKQRMPIR